MVDQQLRDAVAERASYRCEYCRMHEDDDVFTFHVEHIIAHRIVFTALPKKVA